MEMKLEVVAVPVTDVDAAKAFYEKVGFVADHDHEVHADLRFVQLTPPGSACSICIGKGLTKMEPGSIDMLLMVVKSAQEAYEDLSGRGIEVNAPEVLEWGTFVYFTDPDGNRWSLQELPKRG